MSSSKWPTSIYPRKFTQSRKAITILTLGKRLVLMNEAFDANSKPDFTPATDFRARIDLLNRLCSEIGQIARTSESLAYTRGLQYALIRQDGLFPARSSSKTPFPTRVSNYSRCALVMIRTPSP